MFRQNMLLQIARTAEFTFTITQWTLMTRLHMCQFVLIQVAFVAEAFQTVLTFERLQSRVL